jgi:hypothetical protein
MAPSSFVSSGKDGSGRPPGGGAGLSSVRSLICRVSCWSRPVGVFVQGGGFALDRAALEPTGLSGREARERVLGLGSLEYAVLAPATTLAARSTTCGA